MYMILLVGFTTPRPTTTTTTATQEKNNETHGDENEHGEGDDAGRGETTRSCTICIDITECKEPETLTRQCVSTALIQITIGRRA